MLEMMNSDSVSELRKITWKKYAASNGIEWLYKTKNNFGMYRLDCGHHQEITNYNVKCGIFKCRTCKEEKFKKDASTSGIEWVKQIRMGYGLYKLNCGHMQEIPNCNVLNKKFKCKSCQEIKYSNEAEIIGVTWLRHDSPNKGRYRLSCGHEKSIRLDQVRLGEIECKICKDQKFKDDAKNSNIQFLKRSKKGYGLYRFPCNHEQEIQFAHVRIGVFSCQICEETWTQKPSNLYVLLITLQGESFIKIGRSNNLDQRIKNYGLPNGSDVKKIRCVSFETGKDASKAEKTLLKKFKSKKVKNVEHIMKKSGSTECFHASALHEVVEYIDNFFKKENQNVGSYAYK